ELIDVTAVGNDRFRAVGGDQDGFSRSERPTNRRRSLGVLEVSRDKVLRNTGLNRQVPSVKRPVLLVPFGNFGCNIGLQSLRAIIADVIARPLAKIPEA